MTNIKVGDYVYHREIGGIFKVLGEKDDKYVKGGKLYHIDTEPDESGSYWASGKGLEVVESLEAFEQKYYPNGPRRMDESGNMTQANAEAKTHLIEDESLGGLLREYVETNRKADVGDYVINNKNTEDEAYFKVTGYSDEFLPSYTVDYTGKENEEEYTVSVSIDRSITLDPTDIVRINDQRYKLVDRKAEVGEKVVITNVDSEGEGGDYRIGNVLTVEYCTGEMFYVNGKFEDGSKINLWAKEYYVIKPVEEPKIYTCDRCETKLGDIACTNSKGGNYCSRICADKAEGNHVEVDESQASPEVIEMLGNLAVRINELERQIDVLKKRQVLDNIQTLKRGHDRLFSEIDTLHSNQKRMAEELEANDYAIDEINGKLAHLEADVESQEDSAEVIVELAKLLVEKVREAKS